MSNQPITQPQDAQNQAQDLNLDDDTPLAPVCPMNPGEGECEACQ